MCLLMAPGRAGTFVYFFYTGFGGLLCFVYAYSVFSRPGPESSQTFYLCLLRRAGRASKYRNCRCQRVVILYEIRGGSAVLLPARPARSCIPSETPSKNIILAARGATLTA